MATIPYVEWIEVEAAIALMFDDDQRGRDEATAKVLSWRQRGDGVAIYQNADLGSRDIGEIRIISFGSKEAMIDEEPPPERLPDIGGQINWRFHLIGVYRPS